MLFIVVLLLQALVSYCYAANVTQAAAAVRWLCLFLIVERVRRRYSALLLSMCEII